MNKVFWEALGQCTGDGRLNGQVGNDLLLFGRHRVAHRRPQVVERHSLTLQFLEEEAGNTWACKVR